MTKFKVEGFRELDKALGDLAQEMGPRKARTPLRQALQDAAKPVADHARGLVRVDQGQLRDSIRVGGVLNRSQRRGYAKQSEIEVHIGPSGVPQAITEEFGTSDQAPHPFLRPAWEAGKEKVLDDFKGALRDRLDRAVKRLAKARAKG